MEQKIIKIGNSYGIIIPKQVIRELKLKLGQTLYIDTYTTEKTFTLRVNKNLAKGVTPEFIRFLDTFLKRHDSAFRELAKR